MIQIDQLDAITLFYLLKTSDAPDSPVTLENCADEFLRTREELQKLLSKKDSDALKERIENGTFSF